MDDAPEAPVSKAARAWLSLIKPRGFTHQIVARFSTPLPMSQTAKRVHSLMDALSADYRGLRWCVGYPLVHGMVVLTLVVGAHKLSEHAIRLAASRSRFGGLLTITSITEPQEVRSALLTALSVIGVIDYSEMYQPPAKRKAPIRRIY